MSATTQRSAERKLRVALLEMVAFEERVLLNSYWPVAEVPIPPSQRRLCAFFANEVPRDDLARLKRARLALGLLWWGTLSFSKGIRPGGAR